MFELVLLILASAAGLVLVIGCLILLWKGRIVLDAKGEVSKIELPWLKFSTQIPVLFLFLFGVVLLLYPIYQVRNICPDFSLHRKIYPEMVKVHGEVLSKEPVDVFAVVDEQSNTQKAVILNVPYKKDMRYRVLYAVGNRVLETSSFDLPNTNTFELPKYEVQSAPQAGSESGPAGKPTTVPNEMAAQFKKEGQNR
jgi:hypothetical protein